MPYQAGAIIEGVDGGIGHIGDELGKSLAIDDINQDNRDDVIMGAPGASGPGNSIQYAGEVYLWLGRALEGQRFIVNTQASWIVYGEEYRGQLGTAITTGDFDNDGFPEILLGCPSCEQEGEPLFLSGRGYVLEPNQINDLVPVTSVSKLDLIPYKDTRCLGMDVHSLDIDGNSIDDLLISAPCEDFEGNLPGSVFIVSYPFIVFSPMVNK
jgi:hypothetical protein